MNVPRAIQKVRRRHRDFRNNELTRSHPARALLRYLWISGRLHILNQEVRLEFLDGIKCRVRKGDGIVGNYFFHLYEYEESLFFLHYLRGSDSLVDVGANVGHFSLIAAHWSGAQVMAIEPIPSTFQRLLTNLELNDLRGSGPGLVDPRNVGLADAHGVLRFTTNRHTANRVALEPTPDSVEVPVTALDELCVPGSIDLVKIDVEGFEHNVLRGGSAQLESDRLAAVVIELNGSGKEFGSDDHQVVELLSAQRYRPWRYDPFERELTPLEGPNPAGYNTIFIKDLERVRARVREAAPVPVAPGRMI